MNNLKRIVLNIAALRPPSPVNQIGPCIPRWCNVYNLLDEQLDHRLVELPLHDMSGVSRCTWLGLHVRIPNVSPGE